jgi:serine phosphatase RsbU (regulator of sigma subunit)
MTTARPSITSTESFLSRAQRSEEHRVRLWLGVLVGMLLVMIGRRIGGGVVMSANIAFVPTVAVLTASIVFQIVLLSMLRGANRRMTLLPESLWRVSTMLDLCVPAAVLGILGFTSPRGAVTALSGPSLLLLPLVVLTSVLRLRPRLTLYAGLAGAAFHWALTLHAIRVAAVSSDWYPALFSYGLILIFIAFAGTLVAHEMKQHVREAVDEATAHEQAARRIAAVEHDLSVARDIQSGLLPIGTPTYAGFDIAGMNRPADQTGGDYYDWQELPDGRLVAVLADVTGHGIGPAIVMAVCRAYARASASIIREPAVLMARLNDLLLADLPADRFITFAMAMLQPDGKVELLSAGHGPTFLYRASTRSIEQFSGDGLPLGVAPSEIYGPAATFQMEVGDVLVMLTDGFFEWHRPSDGEQFGIERLSANVLAAVHCDAASMIKTLDAAVLEFAKGSEQPDDMTAVVIKRTASSRGDGATL